MFKYLKPYHSTLYIIALSLIIISLPLSRFGLSVAQFILLGNWLLEGNFRRKINQFSVSKPAIILVSFYLLHVIGLLYTSDFEYAMKDLRVKLPLLALPVILATTKPLEKKKFDLLLLLFIGAVLTGTLINFGILLPKSIGDIREISPFISHIRFSLNVCIAIFISGYFAFSKYVNNLKVVLAFLVIIVWLVFFLAISESVTGVLILIVTNIFLIIYALFKLKRIKLKIAFALVFVIVISVLFVYIRNTTDSYFTPHKNDLNNLDAVTSRGNPYIHDTVIHPVENGSYIGLYVCTAELKNFWNRKSSLDFNKLDKKGQKLRFTLIRYLNSKNLRKDADGVNQLNENDIKNIEQGIANVHYAKKLSLKSRIYKIFWEYQAYKRNGNPGGHSLIQRLEFWKVSFQIIKDNFWIGVGTGDTDSAFKSQYEKINSQLSMEWRLRSHNQFLAIFVTFGILGLLWFVFTLFYPALRLEILFDYKYFIFLIIIVLSMLVEDTLETQMGVSLYAFFNSFLLFSQKR